MKEHSKALKAISRRKFLTQAGVLSTFFIVPRSVLGGKGFLVPSDRITLGFIGAGRQAAGLQKNFIGCEEAQVVAVSDVYKMKVDSFVKQVNAAYAAKSNQNTYKGCDAYEDFTQLLHRKDIDAVVIATPDHWHGVQAVWAAAAGKDIYCEKPLSLTVAEGRAMVNATRKHKRVFQTGSMQRSWPEFRQAVELVRNGYIGEIKNIKVSVGGPPVAYNLPEEKLPDGLNWDKWLGPNIAYSHYNNQLDPALDANFWGKWRNFKEFGGGQMTDWGAHMFDIAQWALDMDTRGPVAVIPPDGKDYPFLTYRYENGITMTHEIFGANNAVQFNGTKGKIEVQRQKIKTDPESLATKEIAAGEQRVYFSSNHYQDFLTAIRKRTTPICDVETGHRTATVCNIGNIAYALKKPLHWDYKKEQFNDADADALLKREMRKGYMI
jgi:predicted dehydrogenase